jgi:phospholipid/cholesterol/gamma-HCH transport system permease protein
VDPFVLLVVPRVLSLAISVFCLSAVLVCAALASAYLVALVINHPELKPYGLVLDAVQSVGALGFALLPAKTLLIGFVVGTVSALTALFGQQREIQLGRLMSSAFAGSVLSVFAIVGLFSVVH